MSGQHHVGAFEKKVRALVEGFHREFPASDQAVIFGGAPMAVADVLARLEAMVASFEAVHRAHRSFRQAVDDRRRAMKGHRTTYEDALVLLKHHLGRASPRLMEFGLAQPKARRAPTAEAKAIARAKAAATRKARGTLGKRQRLALGRAPEPTLQVFGPDGQPLGATPATAESPPSDQEPRGAG